MQTPVYHWRPPTCRREPDAIAVGTIPTTSAPLSSIPSMTVDHHHRYPGHGVPGCRCHLRPSFAGYNEDDCRSAGGLARLARSAAGQADRGPYRCSAPAPGDSAPNEEITDWLIKINALIGKLTADVPADPEERDEEQHARWILANIVDWHGREEKAVWWEYFRLADLTAEGLLEERAGLSGLIHVGDVSGTARPPIHCYRFPPQETEIRGGEDLRKLGGDKLGKIEAISFDDYTVVDGVPRRGGGPRRGGLQLQPVLRSAQGEAKGCREDADGGSRTLGEARSWMHIKMSRR